MVSFIYKEQNRKSPSILRASAQIWENTFVLTYITTIPLNENKRGKHQDLEQKGGGIPSSGMDRRGIDVADRRSSSRFCRNRTTD